MPADDNFRKPGQPFNLHEKFTLIKPLQNIQTPNKKIKIKIETP